MSTKQIPENETPTNTTSSNGWRTFGIVMITVILTSLIGYWVVTTYLFPSKFTPVELDQDEQQQLEHKLQRIGISSTSSQQATLEPQPYSEAGASREIHLSERELNSMLANNTDLASKLVIDLSDNLASARLLVHLDEDFPFLGGNTVKLSAGMELSLSDGKPIAILRGVSAWGVPLPNAWMGNMKNINLIEEFGASGGFWQAINDGVEEIDVEDGQLRIKLKE